jgi:pimeloyl-ACP methyl ester carboxylesterase
MDKGVHTTVDGDTFFIPMDGTTSIRHWLRRFQELAAFASEESSRHYGRAPERVFAVGVSNGGYLVRRLLEESPDLVHGGVDVSGVLWRPERNLLISLPRMLRTGLSVDPAWEQALAVYRSLYWEASLAVFISDLDPAYEGPLADYDLASRPAAVHTTVAEISNTGRPGRPLASLSGSQDFLVTPADHAEAYRDLAAASGQHRLSLVADATHIDADRALIPAAQPLMPHAHQAFLSLVAQAADRPQAR